MALSKRLESQIQFLHGYSACDVSDALLKLQKPVAGQVAKAGYLADIVPYAPSSPFAPSVHQPKVIAPASTLQLVHKHVPGGSLANRGNVASGIPKGSHWVDMADAGTIVVIDQPEDQTCAAIGGIMALRMKARGVAGCVVSGRVRDLAELNSSGLPIWAAARSTVGTGAEAQVHSRNLPVTVAGVLVHPGDIIFCDPLEGVVVIPQNLLEDTIELIPQLVEADEKVKDAVADGITVAEAFQTFRG